MLKTTRLDWILNKLAILGILIYQGIGRRFYKRTCLFEPTCSRYAVQCFKNHPFKQALNLTRSRLSECQGTYSLRLDRQGKVEMITHSGRVVTEAEISPIIGLKLKQFSFISDTNLNSDQTNST
ncbi:membrane protein insertion efficiency factor YidD [Sodalinema sp.]|uniref:membrane protein insertion efficiency factor YidD n=1 Tax=Sodalinema sp. TaxID=3080550 RepID=UPI0011F5272A|nr:MAG: membrane protein insertion efficiency factor YidD [Phormidium sp. SL48-SHIP]